MKVFYNLESYNWSNVTLTTGVFDGVHLGHQLLIKCLTDKAKENGSKSLLITFDPHPRKVLFPNEPLNVLTTVEERILLLKHTGVDGVLVLPFTKEFSTLTPEAFIEVLVSKIGMSHFIIGYDHRFGNNREGSAERLNQLSKRFGFTYEQMSALKDKNAVISSSRIRSLLALGAVDKVKKIMGKHYILHGSVEHGAKLGRRIGFPTANVVPEEGKVLPKIGVYAVCVTINGVSFKGMLNIGMRPTVASVEKKMTIEVNVFNFSRDIYNNKITLHFVEYIRDEMKFGGVDELKSQLQKDKHRVLTILNSNE